MTKKQKRFCDEYLIDLNATQAAIRAGYSQDTAGSIGAENLKKPVIKRYIEDQLQEIKNKKIADATEVMEYLTTALRDKKGLARDRLKAAELLGKTYGLYSEKVSVDADMDLTIRIDYGDG